VAATAGQSHDRERGHDAGDRHDRKGPPLGRLVVTEVLRQVGVHADLDLVDQLQEAPRGERRHDTDQRRQHEQHDEALAADR